MATIAETAADGGRRPDLLSGTPRAHAIDRWIYVFTAAIRDGYYVLAVIGVLNSAISAGYYVRVLIAMYLTPGHEGAERVARQPYLLTSIVVSAVLTVLVGVFPALWMQFARLSFLSL